uniref:Phosphatidic acid phosphatase type 2/haloperoxidase domain-containing protein n=1 Tax=Heterosigma akashiwo TaxID=2829 RepID=A0A7S4DJ78_HETAK
MELLVLIFLLMNKDSFKPTEMNRISPPEIEVMIGEVPVSLTNSDHSFPLRVDGIWCTAADFEACEGILTSSGCCSAQHYEEIIPGTQLQWLLRYIPLIFILGRFFLLRLTKKMPVRIFFDSLVALFSTWLAVEITTGFLKNFVGYPRPNYYALRAYKRLNDGGSDGAANQSFPSSHASYSMGGMAFVALLLLQDWQHLRAPAQKGGPPRLPAGSLLPHLAASFPLAYAVFVAASRVRDHFHFPADVATGMALGLGAALFGLRCGGDSPPLLPCPCARRRCARVTHHGEACARTSDAAALLAISAAARPSWRRQRCAAAAQPLFVAAVPLLLLPSVGAGAVAAEEGAGGAQESVAFCWAEEKAGWQPLAAPNPLRLPPHHHYYCR